MSGTSQQARLRAIARRAAEAIVRPEDADLVRRVNATIGGAGTIDGGSIVGNLPPQLVQDESVVVEPNDLSTATNLEALLADLVAAILAFQSVTSGVLVQEVDGSPIGRAETIVFPDGSLTWDLATKTMTVALTGGGGGTGGGARYLYHFGPMDTQPTWLTYEGTVLEYDG